MEINLIFWFGMTEKDIDFTYFFTYHSISSSYFTKTLSKTFQNTPNFPKNSKYRKTQN